MQKKNKPYWLNSKHLGLKEDLYVPKLNQIWPGVACFLGTRAAVAKSDLTVSSHIYIFKSMWNVG